MDRRILLLLMILGAILAVQVMGDDDDSLGNNPHGVGSDLPALSPSDEDKPAEAPEIRKLGKHDHHSDKSVAGGGVIIGGLVTAIFAAVFCYIRVTRKRNVHGAPLT